MNSKIFIGRVMHSRIGPKNHSFSYPVYYYGIDLDELPQLNCQVKGFGYNRLAAVSIQDRDYLDGRGGSIKEKLTSFLNKHGEKYQIGRIFLVTAARYFNYVFNPVSFYYCYDTSNNLRTLVAEVNNTFKERHLYILSEERTANPGYMKHYTVRKDFHVSPFYDMGGEYDFHFANIDDRLDIRLNVLKKGKEVFYSRIQGKPIELTTKNLWRTIMRYPINAALTMPRILWQAAKLHYQKRLPVFTKPAPRSNMTIRTTPPKLFERIGMILAKRFFRQIKTGFLQVNLPNERTPWQFGNRQTKISATIDVRDFRFFRLVLSRGDIGFGEAFEAGYWDSDNVETVLHLLASNKPNANDRKFITSKLTKWSSRVAHVLRKNTRSGSKQNIADHYDLGNSFFSGFLDPTMTYSAGIFNSPNDTLEQAQQNKLSRIIKKLSIRPDAKVLEIGSGWGSFAIKAASETGCQINTITLSQRQKEVVEQRIEKNGVQERVTVALQDYRDLSGCYDRVVSIEMIEAVGEAYLSTYFKTIEHLLKPGGKAMIQAIVFSEKDYDTYRNSCDWIQKYIFPGSHIPSMSKLYEVVHRHTNLEIREVSAFGESYVQTLRGWRQRLLSYENRLDELEIDNKLFRRWLYYLNYCIAGFQIGRVNVAQVLLEKSHAHDRLRTADLNASHLFSLQPESENVAS